MVLQHSSQDLERILRECRRAGDRLHLQHLRAFLHKNGLDIHTSLGNHLVPILVEAGNLQGAHQLFDSLCRRNEYSWTSIIAAYVRSSRPQRALALYEDMLKDNAVCPSGHTFLALLKACAALKSLEKGLEIHSKINELGLSQKDVFLGSALLDMYSKCGSLLKAQQVFDKLPVQNVVCWNALISAYVECGRAREALGFFWKMQLNGTRPDTVTFICSLKACSSARAISEGRDIHFELVRLGSLDADLNVGNALIDMYAKCGFLFTANEVFNKLTKQDVVSWTAIIGGYAEHGHAAKALSCFDLMRKSGICPSVITYICCLKACASLQALTRGRELHADIEKENLFKSNPAVLNSLVDMYAKCGELTKAKELFDRFRVKDNVSWASLISAYAEHGYDEELGKCFERMEFDGVQADAILLVSMLKGCICIRNFDKGMFIHSEIERRGLLKENFVLGNTLVDMYAKFGFALKSKQVFDSLSARDLVSWNVLMAGYAELGLVEETVNCLDRMICEGVSPDAATFVCILKACGIMGATDKGVDIHAEIERRGLLQQDTLVGSILVDMYARCGLLSKAQEVLYDLPSRDVVSWTSLMEGYAQLGESDCVFSAFDRMLAEHICPDPVTFVVVLSVCSQKGMFLKTQTYVEAMSKSFGIVPITKHQNCMLDLYARSGHLDELAEIMGKLPSTPDLVGLRTLLGACKKLGNMKFAELVYKHVITSDQKSSARFSTITGCLPLAG